LWLKKKKMPGGQEKTNKKKVPRHLGGVSIFRQKRDPSKNKGKAGIFQFKSMESKSGGFPNGTREGEKAPFNMRIGYESPDEKIVWEDNQGGPTGRQERF